jgi:Carboxypeptidase regulatory-like domain
MGIIRIGGAALLAAGMACAQTAALHGKVAESSGAAIAGAQVAATDAASGMTRVTRSDAAGAYTLPGLAAGSYTVTFSAPGFANQSRQITLAAGAETALNAALTPALSLGSLGFPASETQGNAKEQAMLNRRSHMLHIHQNLGLITMIPLVATVVSGGFAGGRATRTSARNLHAILGTTTAALYGATAYYAIAAPKLPGVKKRGPIKLHEAMAWIHVPGMILTPILGAMAYSQRSKGERVHGIARLHGQVAIITLAAYTIALLSVTVHSGPVGHAASSSLHAALHLFGRRKPAAAAALTGARP